MMSREHSDKEALTGRGYSASCFGIKMEVSWSNDYNLGLYSNVDFQALFLTSL